MPLIQGGPSRRMVLLLGMAVLAVAPRVYAAPASRPRIAPAALARLEQRAKESESDAVVIYQDGKLVAEWYFGKPRGPIEAMSATKSIVNLAIGRLIDTHKLRSLDQPVHELFPEWKQGQKQNITIRHLLNHTSGLQNEPNTGIEIYPSPDFVKLALAAELTSAPGTQFGYNNKAANLLSGIVRVASGKPMDRYLRDEIFAPMEITDFTWSTDGAGTPQAMAGFQVHARDLAKLGQMLLDGGVWKGQRLLSAAWIAESTRPGQPLVPSCGLLWWLVTDYRKIIANDELIAKWRKGGVPEEFIAKLAPYKDRVFTQRADVLAALNATVGKAAWEDNTVGRGLPAGKTLPAPIDGFYADGFLGQFLVVIPAARIVAVRQRRVPEGPDAEAKINDDRLAFADFPELVRRLTTP